MTGPDEILSFWFPAELATAGEPRFFEHAKFWFRGGADEEIRRRFTEPTAQALDGGWVDWSAKRAIAWPWCCCSISFRAACSETRRARSPARSAPNA